MTFEERKAAITKQKQTTSCAACGQKGHWAGDDACPKKGEFKKAVVKTVLSRGSAAMGKKAPPPKGKKRPEQGFFVLDDGDFEDGAAFAAETLKTLRGTGVAAGQTTPRLPAPDGVDGTDENLRPSGAAHELELAQAAAYEAEIDSTCRDTSACNCYWCRKVRLLSLGVRPSLSERAAEHGLDESNYGGWIGLATVLRGMGEVSDGEWEEISKDWLESESENGEEAGYGSADSGYRTAEDAAEDEPPAAAASVAVPPYGS